MLGPGQRPCQWQVQRWTDPSHRAKTCLKVTSGSRALTWLVEISHNRHVSILSVFHVSGSQ